MAISDTIESMYENTENAYDKVQEKGGTIPANKNLQNLASAIDSISSSSFNPASLNELAEVVYDWFTSKVQLEDKANYTQNAITIYTPNANNKTYVIRQRNDTFKYHIVWLPTGYGASKITNSMRMAYPMEYFSVYRSGVAFVYETLGTSLHFAARDWLANYSTPYYISTNTYNTVEEAITAIQSSSTAYSVWTSGGIFSSVDSGPVYSNCDFYVSHYDEYLQDSTNFSSFNDFYKPTPISPNETIEVIQ